MMGIGLGLNGSQCTANPENSAAELSRQIVYSFTLHNPANRVLQRVEFWTYAPVKQTATQQCTHIEASHPYELLVDEAGNQVLYFTFQNFPPYATKMITIRANLVLSATETPDLPVNPQRFLQAEQYIEVDHPMIQEVARQFPRVSPVETAKTIFDWVSQTVQYHGYESADRGALYALQHKQGDCTEFMYLFIALCRANQIPARGIGGYICPKDMILKPAAYHNWAEFYDGTGWRLADPQNTVFMQKATQYIAMRILEQSSKNPLEGYHRFRFVGDGLEVLMNK